LIGPGPTSVFQNPDGHTLFIEQPDDGDPEFGGDFYYSIYVENDDISNFNNAMRLRTVGNISTSLHASTMGDDSTGILGYSGGENSIGIEATSVGDNSVGFDIEVTGATSTAVLLAANGGVGSYGFVEDSGADVTNFITSPTKIGSVSGDPEAAVRLLEVEQNADGYTASFFNDGGTDARQGVFIQGGLDVNPTSAMNFLEFRDGDGTVIGAIEGNGAGGVTNASTGSDYAELFDGNRNAVAPGDILCVGAGGQVGKATPGCNILGAYSTEPNTLGNWRNGWENDMSLIPVALLGQVRVRVNASNGAIAAGDPIGLSSVNGIGAKALASGYIVGTALQSYSGGGSGLIMATITPRYYFGENTAVDLANNAWVGLSESGGRIAFAEAEGAETADKILIKEANLGLGTDSPSARLHVQSNAPNGYAAKIVNQGGTQSRAGLLIQAGASDQALSNPSTLIQFNDGDGDPVGSITFANNQTYYNQASDARLKTDIHDSTLSLDTLLDIRVRDYTWKSDKRKVTSHGFIAQELHAVYPDAVTRPANPQGTWMVDYSKLTPLIVKGIQDQQSLIRSLQDRLTALQKTVDGLKLASEATSQSRLDVTGPASILGGLKVRGLLDFDADSVGQARIAGGQTAVRVRFSQSYRNQPIVTATPTDFLNGGYRVSQLSNTGFTIELERAQSHDATFNWHSFAAADGLLHLSDNTRQTIRLVIADYVLQQPPPVTFTPPPAPVAEVPAAQPQPSVPALPPASTTEETESSAPVAPTKPKQPVNSAAIADPAEPDPPADTEKTAVVETQTTGL
jgi:hypothetical protein